MKKIVSAVMLALILISTLTVAFNIKPVKAEGDTIYIRADGSIDPPSAPIQRDGNIYTFTSNIYNYSLVVERDDVIVDGAGFALQGAGIVDSKGIELSFRMHVTIQNVEIENFYYGIYLTQSSYNAIYGNTITQCGHSPILYLTMWPYTPPLEEGIAILLDSSDYNIISGNRITDNWSGIELIESSNNIISGNTITNQWWGISLGRSSSNSITRNIFINDGLVIFFDSYGNRVEDNTVNGKPLVYLEGVSDYSVLGNVGQVIMVNCDNIRVENLYLANTSIGVQLWKTNNSIVSGNNLINNWFGIWQGLSLNNTISENSITGNWAGIFGLRSNNSIIFENKITNIRTGFYLSWSSNNRISGNNVTNNWGGIEFSYSSNNIISGNNIANNEYDIGLYYSSNNVFYHNNLIDNVQQVSIYPIGYANVWDDGYPFGGNYWSDYIGVDEKSGTNQDLPGSDGIGDTPYIIDENNIDHYPLMKPWSPVETWSFDSDFQYNLDDNYGTAEGNGHIRGTATLSDSDLLISGEVSIGGQVPSQIPTVYLIATDGLDKEYAKQIVGLSQFSYSQKAPNTYTFQGKIPNAIKPVNNGHYEVEALITYNNQQYEFFINTNSRINKHYLPLATLPPPENLPPTCVIKLQKEGVEISEVNVGEFFDIYVGDSTDDTGIKQVRFSSDDVQDGSPTGKWTEWYEWEISSGDWDAYSKIKRWAFATPGYKEVWAEVKDDIGQTAQGHATIFVPYPALPVLTSTLVITPEKDFYVVGDSVTGEFTIKNIGDEAITLDILTIGGRLNGWSVIDFPHISITLHPDESYHYKGRITFDQHGSYRFFIAYHIQNPTPEEKQLLDENNWNTCVQLGEGLTHTDRVKNIVVFEEETVPEEISELKEQINRLKQQRPNYPPYLCDPNSFWSGVAVVWMDITSFGRLTQKYDELYNAGIEYDSLAYSALISADRLLDKALQEGDQKYVEGAKWLLQEYYRYRKLSDTCFTAALEVFDNHLATAEKLALGIFLTAIKLEVSIVYPPAAPFVDAIVDGVKFGYTVQTEGWTPAIIDLAVELTSKLLFKVNFKSLGLYNLEEYVNRFTPKPLELFMNEEFVKEIRDTLEEIIKKRVLVEIGVEILDEDIKIIVDKTINNLKSLMNFIEAKIKSPVKIRVLDYKGQTTGLVNERVKHEIPMSYYNNGTVIIFFPENSYLYEVTGEEEGIYAIEIASTKNGETTTFIATNIPTSINTIHQYVIDWVALSLGEEGVSVQVDFDGDGFFECRFTSDSELTQSEYIIATDSTPPETSILIGDPKFVVGDMTYLTSATSISLVAVDNVGGSGVALTAYRIYNASYDSGWINYTEPFHLSGLSDGVYYIDFNSTDYAGNVELTNTITVILDNTPPETTITVGEPKYVSNTIYVTPETPFTLNAGDGEGSGILSTAYRIYNSTYDSDWLTYTKPFNLTALADGTYTIEYYSIDNLGNVEATKSIQITLFSWNYVFTDSYGRGTTLKINLAHKLFQFITPDKDYGIRNATYMRVYKRAIIIYHKDNELKLATISIDTQLDFCIAYAKDNQTGKEYWLIDKAGNE